MFYKKQENEQGNYIDRNGKRYDILSCNITESKQMRQIGTRMVETEQPNVFIEVPIMEEYIAINDGWDEFESEEQAGVAYSLKFKNKK